MLQWFTVIVSYPRTSLLPLASCFRYKMPRARSFGTPALVLSRPRSVKAEAKADRVDDAVAALDVDGVVRVRAERLLADDGVVHEVLPHGVPVRERAVEALEVGRGDLGRGELAFNNVHLDDVGGDGAAHGLVGLQGGIGGGEDGEGTGARELGRHARGLEEVVELAKVLVALEVVLLLAHGDAVGSPDLAGALEVLQGAEDVAAAAAAGRGGGGRSSGGSGGGGGAPLGRPLLEVLLERRRGRDGLAGILVGLGVGVARVGHASSPDLLEDGGRLPDLSGGHEGAGAGDESEGECELHG